MPRVWFGPAAIARSGLSSLRVIFARLAGTGFVHLSKATIGILYVSRVSDGHSVNFAVF